MRIVALLLAAALALSAQPGTITTIAGAYWTGDGGPATRARMLSPGSLDVDREGNIFVMDSGLAVIWKIAPNGTITIVAGTGQQGFTADGAQGRQTSFRPQSTSAVRITMDGELLYADSNNNRVRKVNRDGVVSTIVGTGVAGFSGDGGPATAAQVEAPLALALDSTGNLYIGEGCRIRRVSTNGQIETVAGAIDCGLVADSGPAVGTRLGLIASLAVDEADVLYWTQHEVRDGVINYNAASIRRLLDGNQYLIHTTGWAPGLLAHNGTLLHGGNLNQVRRVASNGSSTVVAGTSRGFSGDGGPATSAQFQTIWGLALHADGRLLVADSWNHRVRQIDRDGIVTTIAGSDPVQGDNGPSAFARLDSPSELALLPNGDLVVGHDNRIRLISSSTIRTVAGDGIYESTGDGGPAVAARLRGSEGVAAESSGNIYVSQDSGAIRRISPDGIITLFVGHYGDPAQLPSGDGVVGLAEGMAFDAAGNLYWADRFNHVVRRLDASGVITTLAGSGRPGFGGDGGPATSALLNTPQGVAVDGDGNLFIADNVNDRVRKVDKNGIITTLAGSTNGFGGDGGPSTQARLARPRRLCLDTAGNLYVSEGWNNRIRRITRNGIITTVAGTGRNEHSGDGGPANQASLSSPTGIAIDNNGNLYIADTGSHRIRRVQGVVSMSATPAALQFPFTLGAPAGSQFLTVNVADQQPRPITVETSVPWLRATPPAGQAPGVFNITANPGGLRPGTYSGRITITNQDDNRERVDVAVLMSISGSAQEIQLSQTGLLFAAVQNGPAPPSQTFRVLNAGIGALDWQVTPSVTAGARWLDVTPAAGRTDVQQRSPAVDVKVNPAGLAPGIYYGLVSVSAARVDNSPQAVTVVLQVFPADRPPTPAVYPNGLIFTGAPNAGRPAQTIDVSNLTSQNQTVAASLSFPDTRRWLELATTAAQPLLSGQTVRISVRPQLLGIPVGVYTATINLTVNPGNLRSSVTALLVITDAPTNSATASKQAAGGCLPKRWLPVFRQPGANYAATAGWPVPVEVDVVDDCARPMTAGSVVVAFSQGDPPLTLRHISEGRWTGTWTSRNSRSTGVSLTARAETAVPALTGEGRITGGVATQTDQPLITPRGVQNEASLTGRGTTAIGTRVRIVGSRLATGALQAPTGGPLPAELGGTNAIVGGRPVPLLSVAEGELAAILPFGLAANTTHQLIVRNGTRLSPPEPVLVTAEDPALFTLDGTGRGQAQAYVMTDSGPVLADLARPARAGDRLIVMAAGLGAVSPAHEERNTAPEGSAIRALAAMTAEIQGVRAEVESAMLAPGQVGIYRVALLVPAGLTPDPAAILLLKAGEVASPPVTLAVE
ncbi:MAG: hypothetical protein JNK87_11870 [Bryobacterales bacterium]|nr:hypothetical protein [Bryobacterales bacterium]